jgi:hypothetical protein
MSQIDFKPVEVDAINIAVWPVALRLEESCKGSEKIHHVLATAARSFPCAKGGSHSIKKSTALGGNPLCLRRQHAHVVA